jgi:hypothetical protein
MNKILAAVIALIGFTSMAYGQSQTITVWAGGRLSPMTTYGSAPGGGAGTGLYPVTNTYVLNTATQVTPGNGISAPTGTAPSVSSPTTAFNEMYNGTTWDALQGDANKNLKVNLQASGDPCMGQAKTPLAINQNGTSSVQLIALSGSTKITICSLFLMTNSTATTFAITTGTGTACATGNAAVIGSTTANVANSANLVAGSGLTYGNGSGTVAAGASSGELCMILGSNVYVSGNLTYVQQ